MRNDQKPTCSSCIIFEPPSFKILSLLCGYHTPQYSLKINQIPAIAFSPYNIKIATHQFEFFWLSNPLYGTAMQIEEALITDHLCASRVSWKFRIVTTYNFAVTYPWGFLFSWKVSYFLTVSIVFPVDKQNFTSQQLKN